jgi:hypothetical protein
MVDSEYGRGGAGKAVCRRYGATVIGHPVSCHPWIDCFDFLPRFQHPDRW